MIEYYVNNTPWFTEDGIPKEDFVVLYAIEKTKCNIYNPCPKSIETKRVTVPVNVIESGGTKRFVVNILGNYEFKGKTLYFMPEEEK